VYSVAAELASAVGPAFVAGLASPLVDLQVGFALTLGGPSKPLPKEPTQTM
jgi:hypothetical protein